MTKKKTTTKSKIVSAAWKLFYEQGYDHTTVDEIIKASGTSKGTFYHYFNGKDGLLSSLSYLFDEKYEELLREMDPAMNSFEKLMYLNQELFEMVESQVSKELLASLYSSQLVTKGDKHLLDQNRVYYKMLNKIAAEGQQRGELTTNMPAYEIAKVYALCERAFLYDWCLSGNEYSLKEYAGRMMRMFLAGIKA